jgi:YidC/Oxa1 family membrane protein insertase
MPPVVFANVLQPLITVCEKILLFFHDHVVASWGMSIILLTLTVRVVLLPLTLKQMRSMRRLQLLAPEIKKIQQKYKDDKQRQQQEMMRFYSENKVNPLASCLPLVFQLPFFFALYYMLRTDLRHDICGQTAVVCSKATAAQFASVGALPGSERFLFIPDLTAAATGAALVVLIVLYVGSQLASGILSSATMDKNQRLLMLGLPIFFVAIVIRFPAGLMVYWITTNLWTIVQGLIARRTVPPLQPATANGAPAPASATSLTRGLLGKRGESEDDKQPVSMAKKSPNGASTAVAAAPPPSPRKKKKRSGRRR